MVLSNPFTCPNGHSFTANAKLRARCPECGAMARKSFGPVKQDETSDGESGTKERLEGSGTEPTTQTKEKEPEPQETKKKIKVIRRGRTARVPIQMAKTTVPLKVSKGIIHRKKVSAKISPAIRLKPKGNREHKVAVVMGENKPYWEQVKDKYWR